jgi:RimJ/RimL family protein N-acetyltransferase
VRLEPLRPEHHADLCRVGLDPDLWKWTTSQVRTPEEMRAYIDTALQWQAEGTALPFAVVPLALGRAAGSTRYANVDRANRRVEIGWTWYGREYQRTGVNTESKYLLIKHAFEVLGAVRVEFKTDSLNEPSRAAILRIGAKEEGILRNHMITWSGRLRHSVYYSVIAEEWPEVKRALESRLAHHPPPISEGRREG